MAEYFLIEHLEYAEMHCMELNIVICKSFNSNEDSLFSRVMVYS